MPNGVNLGSFGRDLGPGAQDPMQQAIAARQTGGQPVPQLNQTTPAAPSGPSPQPGPAPQTAVGGPPQGAAAPPKSETEIILKAMDARLKLIGKIEEAQFGAPKPPAPQGV